MPVSVLLDSLRAVLNAYPAVELGVLFGSMATGRSHPDSDADVGLLPGPGKDLALDEELRIQHALSIAAKCEVDVVRLDRANAIVRREVARHGTPILERSPGVWAHFAATALLDYLDMEPLLVAGQKRYLERIATGAR